MTSLARSLALVLVLSYAAGPAAAQMSYGGYDIGPNYGAMLQEMQRREAEMARRMRENEAQIVAQVMQNPQFQAMHREHVAAGGRTPAPVFAYYYAATAGFTPEGIARFAQNENANRVAELRAIMGVRRAEAERGRAQDGLAAGGHRNNEEFGRSVTGRNTYVTQDGQRFVLPHTRPGELYRDPATGREFLMNPQGQYFVRTPHGWQPMAWFRG